MSDNLRILADIGMRAALSREPLPAPHAVPDPPVLGVAEIECVDGLTIWHRDSAQTVGTPAGLVTRVRREQIVDRFDPLDYAPTQPSEIRVLHRHDRNRRVGFVRYLEWGQGEPARIRAVFEVDATEADAWAGRDAFISPATARDGRGQLVLDHIALCESTARIAAAPVRWSRTTFEGRARWTRQTPDYDLLMRADAARRKRTDGEGIVIVGHPGIDERRGLSRSADPVHDPNELLIAGAVGSVLRVE
jgi:hypothetical protein